MASWLPLSVTQWWTPAATEAADQQMGKRSKLDTAYAADMTRHMKELARQEEVAAAEFRKKKTGVDVGGKQKGGNNDLIVCDNMTIDNGRGGGLTAGAIGALAAAAALYFSGLLNTEKVPTPDFSDTNTQYTIEALEGE